MIPIGAPVTVTWMNGEKQNGIVESYYAFYGLGANLTLFTKVKFRNIIVAYTFSDTQVKIRYDNPSPFTLWQLNTLHDGDAMDWHDWGWAFPRRARFKSTLS